MMSLTTWETAINELILTFQQALIALAPIVEKVKIGWRDEDAYDDWDEITAVLFKSIVANSVIQAIGGAFPLIGFGIRYPNYYQSSFIGLGGVGKPYSAFVKFKSRVSPFDSVDVAILDGDLTCLGFDTVEVKQCDFILYINQRNRIEPRQSIKVEP
jgi:hypothetical protein